MSQIIWKMFLPHTLQYLQPHIENDEFPSPQTLPGPGGQGHPEGDIIWVSGLPTDGAKKSTSPVCDPQTYGRGLSMRKHQASPDRGTTRKTPDLCLRLSTHKR